MKYIKRIVVSTHLGTGLYAEECCDVGPCTRALGHDGPHRDRFDGDRYHPVDGKAGEVDWPASFAAYAAENEAVISTLFDGWFQAGVIAAEEALAGAGSPYPSGSLADHWWTRGYAHASRLVRALSAERKVGDYVARFGELDRTS